MRSSGIRGPPAAGSVSLFDGRATQMGWSAAAYPRGSRDVSSRYLQRADALKVAGPRAASVRDVSHPVPTKLHSIA